MSITKVNQISTKAGDKGSSRNYVNEEFDKDNILFETLGAMDELSSFLGLAYHYSNIEELKEIQRTIQDLNTIVATNPDHIFYGRIRKLDETQTGWLEERMERYLKESPIEPKFILPGSETSLGGAYVDIARALSRKAERLLVRFAKESKREDLKASLMYVNRLSDYLFVLARFLGKSAQE